MANDKWIDIGKDVRDMMDGKKYAVNFEKAFNREDIVNMGEYQSPITAMFDNIEYKIREEHEKQIFEAIQNVGISIDREELLKALQYDRDQYRKGYNDAKTSVFSQFEGRYKSYMEKHGYPRLISVEDMCKIIFGEE